MFSATIIPSSTDQRLTCLAERIHGAGPDVLLQMMRTHLTSSSNAMTLFERFVAHTLPVPSRSGAAPPSVVIDVSHRLQNRGRSS
jgi:hypothetical protein